MRAIIVGVLGCGAIAAPVGAQSVRRTCRAPTAHQATACIMSPREGATLRSPSLRVVLDAKNITIAPVAAGKAGAAHFHVLLDAGLDSWTDPIPAGHPGIVHLGAGQKEHVFENVAAGQHRLIVILGDNAHVPIPNQHVDTVYVTVEVP